MMISEKTQENVLDFARFLAEKKKAIPDKDVRPVYLLRYKTSLNVFEYSYALAMLESQHLLDLRKSLNKKAGFYTQMHENLLHSIQQKG